MAKSKIKIAIESIVKIVTANISYTASIDIDVNSNIIFSSMSELLNRNDERIFGAKIYSGFLAGNTFSMKRIRGRSNPRIIGELIQFGNSSKIHISINSYMAEYLFVSILVWAYISFVLINFMSTAAWCIVMCGLLAPAFPYFAYNKAAKISHKRDIEIFIDELIFIIRAKSSTDNVSTKIYDEKCVIEN